MRGVRVRGTRRPWTRVTAGYVTFSRTCRDATQSVGPEALTLPLSENVSESGLVRIAAVIHGDHVQLVVYARELLAHGEPAALPVS